MSLEPSLVTLAHQVKIVSTQGHDSRLLFKVTTHVLLDGAARAASLGRGARTRLVLV